MNGPVVDSTSCVFEPRQMTPADAIVPSAEGTMSGGLSETREESPDTKRFTPPTGSSAVAPISLQRRDLPVARVLRTSQAAR
jgi:hypothetical protein